MRLAIILTLLFSTKVFSQSLEETFDLGENLYAMGNFKEAEPVLKRVAFFDQETLYADKLYLMLANSLYANGKYAEANYYYDLAYFLSSTEDQIGIILQKTSCFLLLQNYSYARLELFNLPENINPEQEKLRLFYTAMLEFGEKNYELSKENFLDVTSDSLGVVLLFEKVNKVEKLNPKTAKILSIILPGLGQMYAGDWKSGLNSFILTGGLFYLGINNGIKNSFLDAAISVLPWFQRYYTGGFKKAELIAIAKKQERRRKVFEDLLATVNLN